MAKQAALTRFMRVRILLLVPNNFIERKENLMFNWLFHLHTRENTKTSIILAIASLAVLTVEPILALFMFMLVLFLIDKK